MVKGVPAGRSRPIPADKQCKRALLSALSYAESEEYLGYNKHDALNSPVLRALAGKSKWRRLLLIQMVTRSPVNLRPLCLVKKTINPKGISLFCRAYLTLHELNFGTQNIQAPRHAETDVHRQQTQFFKQESQNDTDGAWLQKAYNCLDWLSTHSAIHLRSRYSGHCWGYPYDWQDIGFFAPSGMPNCVVTCFVGRAFIHAYKITGRREYLEIAKSACSFLLKDLPILYDSPEMLCIGYAPVEMHWVVMDTSALAGALLAEVAEQANEPGLRHTAKRLMNYVVDKQTEYGAWYYSHPPKDSHITHDNYHTGFILDAILDYTDATGDQSFLRNYHKGLRFYEEHLFTPTGAPKWMHNKLYPHDVHGSAQGLITFSKAARFGDGYGVLADRIAEWAIANLYDPRRGYFYYQCGRLWTRQFTLMRWCNAWMVWAIASLLLSQRDDYGRS